MYIFLDSNILYDNWQLRNVNFTVLFNFIVNEDAKLLLSELVVQETENNRRKKVEGSLAVLKKELKIIARYNSGEPPYDLSKLEEPYDLKHLLSSKLNSAHIEFFGYDEILQSAVVKRALVPLRPFREEEKGYRDTLIWLSFLKYLVDHKIKDDVFFINANSNDFYDKKKGAFHPDLANDLEENGITCQIHIYNGLAEFVTAKIDKDEHALVRSDLDDIDSSIERESVRFMNNLGLEEIRAFINEYDEVVGGFISITDHWFEIDEGVEDPSIIITKHIQGTAIYVKYEYWLRICTLTLTVSAEEYNSSRFNSPHNIVANEGGLITFEIYVQVNMIASFQYDTDLEDVTDFTVDVYSIRK